MSLGLKRQPKYPPRAPRFAMGIWSSLLLPDDREIAVRIKNLSEEGVMVESRIKILPDTDLGISIPDYGIIRAQIRWIKDGWMGARFHRPINLDHFQHS